MSLSGSRPRTWGPAHTGLSEEKPRQAPAPSSRLSHFRPTCGTRFSPSWPDRPQHGFPIPSLVLLHQVPDSLFSPQRSGFRDSGSQPVLPDAGFFRLPPRPASGRLPLPFSFFPPPRFPITSSAGALIQPRGTLAPKKSSPGSSASEELPAAALLRPGGATRPPWNSQESPGRGAGFATAALPFALENLDVFSVGLRFPQAPGLRMNFDFCSPSGIVVVIGACLFCKRSPLKWRRALPLKSPFKF